MAGLTETISSLGKFREYLGNMLVGVGEGTVELDVATTAAKLAAQINENIHAEVRVSMQRVELGQAAVAFGSTPLGEMAD